MKSCRGKRHTQNLRNVTLSRQNFNWNSPDWTYMYALTCTLAITFARFELQFDAEKKQPQLIYFRIYNSHSRRLCFHCANFLWPYRHCNLSTHERNLECRSWSFCCSIYFNCTWLYFPICCRIIR